MAMDEETKVGFGEFLGETRVIAELLRFEGDQLADHSPRKVGENWRPVLLIPGFLAGDSTLFPLGASLRALGHKVFYSGIGVNADCPKRTLDRIARRLQEINRITGRKAVVIGHSLGGVYARELARREAKL